MIRLRTKLIGSVDNLRFDRNQLSVAWVMRICERNLVKIQVPNKVFGIDSKSINFSGDSLGLWWESNDKIAQHYSTVQYWTRNGVDCFSIWRMTIAIPAMTMEWVCSCFGRSLIRVRLLADNVAIMIGNLIETLYSEWSCLHFLQVVPPYSLCRINWECVVFQWRNIGGLRVQRQQDWNIMITSQVDARRYSQVVCYHRQYRIRNVDALNWEIRQLWCSTQ